MLMVTDLIKMYYYNKIKVAIVCMHVFCKRTCVWSVEECIKKGEAVS